MTSRYNTNYYSNYASPYNSSQSRPIKSSYPYRQSQSYGSRVPQNEADGRYQQQQQPQQLHQQPEKYNTYHYGEVYHEQAEAYHRGDTHLNPREHRRSHPQQYTSSNSNSHPTKQFNKSSTTPSIEHKPKSSSLNRKRGINQKWKQKPKKGDDEEELKEQQISGTTKHGHFDQELLERSLAKKTINIKENQDIKQGVFYHHDKPTKKATKSTQKTTTSTKHKLIKIKEKGKDYQNNISDDDKQYMLTRIADKIKPTQLSSTSQMYDNIPAPVPPNYNERISQSNGIKRLDNKTNKIKLSQSHSHPPPKRHPKQNKDKKNQAQIQNRSIVTVSPSRPQSRPQPRPQSRPRIQAQSYSYGYNRAVAPPPHQNDYHYPYYQAAQYNYNNTTAGGPAGAYYTSQQQWTSGSRGTRATGTGYGYVNHKGHIGHDGAWYPDNVGDLESFSTPKRNKTMNKRGKLSVNVDLTTPTSAKVKRNKNNNNLTEERSLSPGTRVNRIQKQLEYYFSYENMIKDEYLQNVVDNEGYVDINEIIKFNKMQKLQADKSMIIEAAYHSVKIEVDIKTKQKIRPNDIWKKIVKLKLKKKSSKPSKKIKKSSSSSSSSKIDNKDVTPDTIEQIVARIEKDAEKRKKRRAKREKERSKKAKRKKEKKKENEKQDNYNKENEDQNKKEIKKDETDDVNTLIAKDKAEENTNDVGDPSHRDMLEID